MEVKIQRNQWLVKVGVNRKDSEIKDGTETDHGYENKGSVFRNMTVDEFVEV